MDFETVLYKKQNELGIVTLNRPDSLNALNIQLKRELSEVFDELERDSGIRAVILTGAQRAFCAGSDIKERSRTQMTSPEFYFSQMKTQTLFRRIEEFPKVVIGAINGPAIGGGCELSLVCDLRIASEKAKFGLPEVRIGAMPVGGGTQRLPRLIGVARAKGLLFLGDIIDAQEAYRLGLVNRVVPGGKLMEEAGELARRIASNAPLSVKLIKRAINVGGQLDIASGIEYETQCAAVLIETEDRVEGFQAFIEKRAPRFKGL